MIKIANIGQLYTANENSFILEDACILINKDEIFWAGKESDISQSHEKEVSQTIDAKKMAVFPGFIDCHTHLVFSGTREEDFAMRMSGQNYLELQKKGLGINSTVDFTNQSSEDELFNKAFNRLNKILKNGTTTVEIKSGYGLSVTGEMKILSVINKLKNDHRINIHRTFLGAHIVPKGIQKDDYINLINDEMLPYIASNNLADDCDIFCEEGAFTTDDAIKIFSKAKSLGFGLRAHVNQLKSSGGIKLLEYFPIKSLSHCEYLSNDEIKKISAHKTVLEFLPFAALFLRGPIMSTKKIKEANIPLCIATDFNPGSAMCDDLIMAMRLAVTLGEVSINDALLGVTKNAATSLGLSNVGSIQKGFLADLIISNCKSLNDLLYDWTKSPIDIIVKSGKIVD